MISPEGRGRFVSPSRHGRPARENGPFPDLGDRQPTAIMQNLCNINNNQVSKPSSLTQSLGTLSPGARHSFQLEINLTIFLSCFLSMRKACPLSGCASGKPADWPSDLIAFQNADRMLNILRAGIASDDRHRARPDLRMPASHPAFVPAFIPSVMLSVMKDGQLSVFLAFMPSILLASSEYG